MEKNKFISVAFLTGLIIYFNVLLIAFLTRIDFWVDLFEYPQQYIQSGQFLLNLFTHIIYSLPAILVLIALLLLIVDKNKAKVVSLILNMIVTLFFLVNVVGFIIPHMVVGHSVVFFISLIIFVSALLNSILLFLMIKSNSIN